MAKVTLYIVLLFLPTLVGAVDAELGAPVITNFGPREFGGSTQNWCILQDQRGLIYVGNGRGVLEFDGVNWRLIQMTNNAAALSLAVGDATGHGLNAGMMAFVTKGLFVSEESRRGILDFFYKCNTVLRQMHMERIYMALSFFKIKDNRLQMSSAGMPPVYWYKAAEKKVEEICPKGMPLGATENYPYQCEERELAKNDVLLFMTDGFPELFNPQDTIIGYDKIPAIFAECAAKEPKAIIEALKGHIDLWAQGRPNDDDITFVALKIK